MAKKKKPIYRRWWFIVIAIFFILFAIGSMADPPEEKADKPKVEAKKEDKAEVTKAEASKAEKKESKDEKPKVTKDKKEEAKETAEVVKVDKADKKEETKSKEVKPKEAPKIDDEKKADRKDSKATAEKPKEEKKKLEAEPKQPATLEDKIKKTIAKSSKKTLTNLQVNDNYGVEVDGAKLAIITFKDEVGLSIKMDKKILLRDSAKLFEELFKKHAELHNVTLKWELPLVDTYGNEEHGEVLRIELDRATAEKINWAAFNTKNFEAVAMQYFEHPAFNR